MHKKLLILYGVAIVLGVFVGLLGSAFRLSIDVLDSLLVHFFHFAAGQGWHTGLLSGLLSMLLVGAGFLAVKHWAPEAGGSGVQEIEGALLHLRPVRWRRVLPVKFFFGILVLSAKMILGREGPTIHIGGNLGEMLGSVFSMTRRRRDSLIASGAAAGLAVAFNAPLAGVLFVMEEMRNQFNYSFTNFSMVIISCITATVILDLLIGGKATIQMDVFQLPELGALWLFVVLGIVIGFAGLLFNKVLMSSLYWIDKLSSRAKLVYVLLVGFTIGVLAIYYPVVTGDGMEIIHQSLYLSVGWDILLLLFILRFIGTMACYSTGVPGGIFAPSLALGTLLGLALFQILTFLHLESLTHSGMFAVAGMAAFFAAVTRSPITGGVLVVEMTQNYSLIFPVMITCIAATIVVQLTHNGPIYELLLRRTLLKDRR
ncbi:MAG: H(+)/Cl(-) exchange transporter ClcA [Legionella sp.]|uniref:H(+)/Cl(-) exchange transporter ClcA n=1 Tax=Legionella sp. TaxID=459 RepID=UPI0039E285EC